METQTVAETGCCPRFDPEGWTEGEIHWDGKLFVTDHVASFFHVPLNMGTTIKRNMELIEAANAKADVPLMLCDESALFGTELYIDVAHDVPGTRMTHLSGDFLTRVFEGPYRDAGQWARAMKTWVQGQGREMQKLYFAYTTCPKCAKAYGKNYVIAFAQV